MGPLDKYILHLAELKTGIHRFSYSIDNTFFEFFAHSDIKDACINIEIELQKFEDMAILHFNFEGTSNFPCDRCTDLVAVPVKGREKIILKFGATIPAGGSDDVLFIPVIQNDFNVSQHIYEFLNLAVPASRVHDEGKCNSEMIEKLKNLNPESGTGKQKPDPRWDALRKLKLN